MAEYKPCPCEHCEARSELIMRDIDVWGDDCPYPCKRYKEWKGEQDG